MAEQAVYNGVDNLEVMAAARNYNNFLVNRILKHAGSAGTAVDFGAGMGTFAKKLRERGLDVICIEPDEELRQRLSESSLVNHVSVNALPDGSTEFVYSLNVLEHIDDDVAALKDLFNILRPGGRFYLYVPAFMVLFTSMDHKVGHLRRYRRAGLENRLEQAGFVIEKSNYVDSLGFLATLAFKMLDNGSGDLNPRAIALFDRFVFPLSRLGDRFCGRLFGKNLEIVARRPG